jgi:hypothetical protein
VDRLLLKREGAQENSLQTNDTYNFNAVAPTLFVELNDLDESPNLDFLDSFSQAFVSATNLVGGANIPTTADAINRGAIMRQNRAFLEANTNAAGNAVSEYYYKPAIGAWQVDKMLPDRVGIRLTLQISDPAFYTMAPAVAATNWMFVINSLELVLHRVKMADRLIEQNSIAMIERPWVAPCFVMVYSRQTFTSSAGAGTTAINLSGMYNGPLPKFVFIAVQDANSVSNNVLYNPYYIDEGSSGLAQKGSFISNLFLSVNGEQIPRRRPYDPLNHLTHQREYRCLKEFNIDGFPDRAGALVSYAKFSDAYTWIPFAIDPLEGEMDVFAPTSDCNIEVHGTLTSEGAVLPVTQQICHMICFVPSVLAIDGNRVCSLKSKSGIPLVFN